jgi:hypothetical protein
VQELEYLERLGVGGAGAEEKQLVLYDGVEERRGIGVCEVDQRRPRVGMREVEREQCAACGWPANVRVLEERRAVGA